MDQKVKPRIFIGSASESLDTARMIEHRLHSMAEIVMWDAMMIGIGEITIDALIDIVDTVDFAIIVFSNHDKVMSRSNYFEAPRDNVIFELGLFMSKLGKNRTYIINNSPGLKIPSDLAGITFGMLNSTRQDNNLAAAVSPVCTEIEIQITRLGIRPDRINFYNSQKNIISVENDIAKSCQVIFKKIGIHQLDNTLADGLNVKNCIDKVNNTLSFLGVNGKKWAKETEAFTDLMKRLLLRRQTNQIRFLLLNPDCKNALNFNEGRNYAHTDFIDDLNNTVEFFRNLKEKSGLDIQLRLYDHMPNFRVSIIDQSIAVLGTYSTMSIDGLDAPQMVFKTTSEWSLAHNLTAYFEYLWDESKIKL